VGFVLSFFSFHFLLLFVVFLLLFVGVRCL